MGIGDPEELEEGAAEQHRGRAAGGRGSPVVMRRDACEREKQRSVRDRMGSIPANTEG